MKYFILAWLKDWAHLKTCGDPDYDDSAYGDAYIVSDDNGNPRLFDTICGAEMVAQEECKYFKIVDFHGYAIGKR